LQLTKAEPAEKFRIESGSEAECRSPVTGIGRALVKQACRSKVTVAQKSVAMVQSSVSSALENPELGEASQGLYSTAQIRCCTKSNTYYVKRGGELLFSARDEPHAQTFQ